MVGRLLRLMVVSLLLLKLGRPVWFTLLPMAFLLLMTIFALLIQLWDFVSDGKWLLVAMDCLILVAAVMVALEAIGAFLHEWRRVAAANGSRA